MFESHCFQVQILTGCLALCSSSRPFPILTLVFKNIASFKPVPLSFPQVPLMQRISPSSGTQEVEPASALQKERLLGSLAFVYLLKSTYNWYIVKYSEILNIKNNISNFLTKTQISLYQKKRKNTTTNLMHTLSVRGILSDFQSLTFELD